MQCQICHESRGRMRVHMDQYRMTMAQADQLEYYLYKVPGITDASVNDRTANAVIRYEGSREDVILALAAFDPHAAHTPSIAKLRRGLVSILQDRRLASRQ